jgi:hypothetical protein
MYCDVFNGKQLDARMAEDFGKGLTAQREQRPLCFALSRQEPEFESRWGHVKCRTLPVTFFRRAPLVSIAFQSGCENQATKGNP